jgi:signal transduction histidine kinase
MIAASPANAQRSHLLDEYAHRGWTAADGAPQEISAIAQGRDGFLWVGGALGLYRFDGRTFEQIARIPHDRTRSMKVTSILAADDGDLWVGYQYGGLAVFHDGKLREANHGEPHGSLAFIVQSADGAIWTSSQGAKRRDLWRFKNGRWTEIGDDWGMPDVATADMFAGSDGRIWIATENAILVLEPGHRRFRQVVETVPEEGSIAEDASGATWVWTGRSLMRFGPGTSARSTAGTGQRSGIMKFDASGHLLRQARDGLQVLARPANGAKFDRTLLDGSSGLTSGAVAAIFEDREGDTWIGTAAGLDRFRPAALVPRRGPWRFDQDHSSLLLDWRGRVYVNDKTGLYRADGPQGGHLALPAGEGSYGVACPSSGGDVLVAGPLSLRSLRTGRSMALHLPDATSDHRILDCVVDGRGTPVISVLRRGLFTFDKGSWHPLSIPLVPTGANPFRMQLDGRGRVLLNYALHGLARWDGERAVWLGTADQIGVGLVKTMLPVADGLVVGGELGLARYDGARFSVLDATRRPWLGNVTGMVVAGRTTWLLGGQGVARVPTEELAGAFAHPGRELHPKLFGIANGLPGPPQPFGSAAALADPAGRLWFLTSGGLALLDPRRTAPNGVPPAVMIRSATVGSTLYASPRSIVLPRGENSIEIRFGAFGLRAPEDTRARYRLEGQEGWIDPGERREAFYTNLPPGTYSFTVVAGNEDGVWNRRGATLSFVIEPTFTQTWAFWAACILAAIGSGWWLYSLRLRQVTRLVGMRTEERMKERFRIARELHDTLLQGVQGLVLRFQAAIDQLPADTEAAPAMRRAIDEAEDLLGEARERVIALRSTSEPEAFPEQLGTMLHQLFDQTPVRTELTVHGRQRSLVPAVHEELVRIAREALLNARAHAEADAIALEVAFSPRMLRFHVRDDGKGIAPSTLARGGRAGHFGLSGMRERALRIGANIRILSSASGTAVTVTIPARRAYASRDARAIAMR